MSLSKGRGSRRYCGRIFTEEELETIRRIISSREDMTRQEISFKVCEELDWHCPSGRLKDMSCRVALLRMQEDGLIELPAPRTKNNNRRIRPRITSRSDPAFPVVTPAGQLPDLTLDPVLSSKESSLWNEFIERYHYLGYRPLPGAQQRYIARSGYNIVAVLGFGASAWKVECRDRLIGWSPKQREQGLHLIINNARFLILPWVESKNLGSMLLAKAARRIRGDWLEKYGYQPVLLETFVEQGRFSGTCYRAANWMHIGQTKGRGKLDRHWKYPLPIKDVFIYPLVKNFRQVLLSC